jgi:hypothetical protein
MATLFNEDKPYREVITGLREIGYDGGLLQENYAFLDYFSLRMEERRIAAAAFGQTPVSYDSACIGVICTNGLRDQALINQYRALAAPFVLEIDRHEVREWAVSSKENGHALVERYSTDNIREMFVRRAPDWKPEPLLRAKNIGSFHWTTQLSLFSGLLPELEEQIQSKLEPLLDETLSATRAAYLETTGRIPEPSQLFRLIFWLLTAKVFHDRRVPGFVSIGSDPDALLEAVARQHTSATPRLLNRQAREVAATLIWTTLDFRHLSVEVLSQMWASMLIDEETTQRLHLQRTPRTIVRYIVEHVLPAVQSGDDKRIIFEPCSGSAVFLIGAMNFLRQNLPLMNPSERHQYFVKHLAAIETDPFGVEISRLALTLADFPNPNNWEITQADVFQPGTMTDYLRRAGVVLCNPPFGSFDDDERVLYQLRSPKRPVELLERVLDDLHPSGILGFVLPRLVMDGKVYKAIRRRLAERFASLELTILPDRAFSKDSEIGLLVATEPIPHKVCHVVHRRVNDTEDAWRAFELKHEISAHYETDFDVEQATENLGIPELPEIWDFLNTYRQLHEFADLRRGIQWNKPLTDEHGHETGNRKELVRESVEDGFMLGVAPRTKFTVFETPRLYYLNIRLEDQLTDAWQLEWKKPKAILNKAARSRGAWRLAAFPDTEGVICYQTFYGVWPTANYDEWMLSAVLNSPLANAFVATREGKTDITKGTLLRIPMPYLTELQIERLRALIWDYRNEVTTPMSSADPERLLMQMDALVLEGYRMPPKLEHQLLEFFRGQGSDRPTRHPFGDYLPPDCEVYFSLSEHLSPRFKDATIGEMLKRTG